MNVGIFPNPDGRGGNTLATADLFSAGFYAKDRIVISPVSYQFYVKKVSSTTTADPSADSTNWAIIGNGLKSIQRGTVSFSGTSATATLSPAVDVNKTKLTLLGRTNNGGANPIQADDEVNMVLTNSTTITFSKLGTTQTVVVSWQAEEVW